MPENIPKFTIFVAQIIPIVGLWHWFYHMILNFCPILQDTSTVPQVTPLSTVKHLRAADAWAKTSQGAAPDLVHRLEQATEKKKTAVV